MLPIILAGGSGTRFWPLSRRDSPKQLLALFGDGRAMVDITLERLQGLAVQAGHPVQIVCRQDLIPATVDALSEPELATFIAEPSARNTAPAILLAAARAELLTGDEPVGIFPADHYIRGRAGFEETLRLAEERARAGAILTVGIPPTRPETGYGYIECHGDFDDPAEAVGEGAMAVRAFVEKPDRERALEYLSAGRYLWNAGIFVFRPSTLWRELERQHPGFFEAATRLREALADDVEGVAVVEAFEAMEAISIDYAVMEGAERVEVIPAQFHWSDVGHWAALDEVFQTDSNGNVVEARAILDDVHSSIIYSKTSDRLIAAIGVENLVIVDTPDAVLVVPKERAQAVRELHGVLERTGLRGALKA